jgi:hypothetical protein
MTLAITIKIRKTTTVVVFLIYKNVEFVNGDDDLQGREHAHAIFRPEWHHEHP